ncbi:hypothetical protein KQI88_10855 [Alkaliphilus sp. MSJ-5]|uniref:Uncharacterized protein n=1 Tax=Alkaliphilus flagellatus TaxID=2841507 RepID=A0ABS6G447_9FIRM|nr:hypothetical protein [Alkaliphilus flagellatus]MBU5676916.1 hypothetical protein [Alkaliphilus flagellatus]
MKSLLIKANVKLNGVDIEISPEDAINKLIEVFGYGDRGKRGEECFVKNGAIYRAVEKGYGELNWDDILVSKNSNKVKELESLLFLKQRIESKHTLENENDEELEL